MHKENKATWLENGMCKHLRTIHKANLNINVQSRFWSTRQLRSNPILNSTSFEWRPQVYRPFYPKVLPKQCKIVTQNIRQYAGTWPCAASMKSNIIIATNMNHSRVL